MRHTTSRRYVNPPSVCLSVISITCLSVCLSVCLYICLSVCLSVCQSSVCLSVYLSVYLSVRVPDSDGAPARVVPFAVARPAAPLGGLSGGLPCVEAFHPSDEDGDLLLEAEVVGVELFRMTNAREKDGATARTTALGRLRE